jgi:hypothetical protein
VKSSLLDDSENCFGCSIMKPDFETGHRQLCAVQCNGAWWRRAFRWLGSDNSWGIAGHQAGGKKAPGDTGCTHRFLRRRTVRSLPSAPCTAGSGARSERAFRGPGGDSEYDEAIKAGTDHALVLAELVVGL